MVFTFTEEQKRDIENAGVSVIRFKKFCYWFKDVIFDVWDKVKKYPGLLEQIQEINNVNS